jgi:hypothetical protein
MRRPLTVLLALVFAVLVPTAALAFPFDGETWDASEPPNRRIMLVGDSVTAQSGPAAIALGEQREHAVKVWAISGGTPCDFTAGYGGEASTFDAQAVAFAFVGNAARECVETELGWAVDCCLTSAEVAQVVAVYRKHLTTMINWNNTMGVESWLIASPMMAAGTFHGQLTAQLNAMYSDLATATGARYTAAARSLLSPGGAYTATVGGLPVRHPDGTHLRAPYGTTLHATGLLSGPMTNNQ